MAFELKLKDTLIINTKISHILEIIFFFLKVLKFYRLYSKIFEVLKNNSKNLHFCYKMSILRFANSSEKSGHKK